MYKTYRKSASAHLVKGWDRVVVITGASAGIGRSLTVELVKNGFRVAACARRVEKIQEIVGTELKDISDAGHRLLPIKCDVAKEEEIIKMFQEVREKMGSVDILINNAGVVRGSSVSQGDTAGWQEMLDVNVLGLTICIREALSTMKETGTKNGMIINISSVAGHVVITPLQFYSATKFAVTAITEGLRQELLAENSDVRVAQISNGYTDTDVGETVMGSEGWREFIATSNHLAVTDIVEAVKYIVSAPPHVQIHDIMIYPISQPAH